VSEKHISDEIIRAALLCTSVLIAECPLPIGTRPRGEDHDRRTACAHRRCRLRRARLSTSTSQNSSRGQSSTTDLCPSNGSQSPQVQIGQFPGARHRLAVRYDLCNDSPFVYGTRRQGLWIEQERLSTTRTLTPSGTAIKSTLHAEIHRYAELRMISRASRRSVEFLFAPSAIPCIKRSKLSVASRSTSCATVVSEGHAY
jgi:hypothetical protein